MQVLKEMLAYELGAHVALAFEPDGLRCTFHFPLVPRVGRVVEESGADENGDGA